MHSRVPWGNSTPSYHIDCLTFPPRKCKKSAFYILILVCSRTAKKEICKADKRIISQRLLLEKKFWGEKVSLQIFRAGRMKFIASPFRTQKLIYDLTLFAIRIYYCQRCKWKGTQMKQYNNWRPCSAWSATQPIKNGSTEHSLVIA